MRWIFGWMRPGVHDAVLITAIRHPWAPVGLKAGGAPRTKTGDTPCRANRPMTTLPLLIALEDPELLQSVSAAFAARGRAHHVTQDGAQLLGALEGAADVIVDPGLAPAGETPEMFLAGVVSRMSGGGRVLAFCREQADDAALVEIGAADVFDGTTSPSLIVHRMQGATTAVMDAPPATAAAPASPAAADVEPAASEAKDTGDALAGFMERVAVRLTRARERERAVAIFAVSLRGAGADPKATLRTALEGVLEDLDRTQEFSLSSSRIAMAALGEDVYSFLVPDVERVQDAARIAVRLHESMALNAGITAHVGIACSPDNGTLAQELVDKAREAVLRARRGAENHVEFFSESMSRWAFERLTLEQSLRDALRNRELVVYYQPRLDIESRRIVGMEALVRWIHPQFGLVSPGQFIPLAEETGLIVPIGDWILREACRQNAEWRSMGLPDIRVSVNLSPIQFRKPNLHEAVLQALEETGLAPDGLELEVTESLLMNDPAETAAVLGRLKNEGIHISIDDFGTGYSSLSYLKRFPINALKIDRSFVTDVTSNPDDAAIATAIILMGHSLKLTVVAEGVETENQLEFLKVLQCNEVQGYHFSPPVPADRAQVFLEEQRDASAGEGMMAA